MKLISKISLALSYFLLLLGILEFVPGGSLKDGPRIIFIASIAYVFICYIFFSKRQKWLDMLFFIIVSLSSIESMNFIIDIFIQPKEYAVDCEGHHGME